MNKIKDFFNNTYASVVSVIRFFRVYYVWILAAIFLTAVLVFINLDKVAYFITDEVVITITDKEQTGSRAKELGVSKKYVYANGTTYEVSDSKIDFVFNSLDVYSKLEIGKTYRVKTRGIRFGFFSLVPNIVKIYERIETKNE